MIASTLKRHFRRPSESIWTLIALVVGVVLGSSFRVLLAPVADGTASGLTYFVKIVPLLIVIALSPAVFKLTGTGRAGRLAAGVVAWYVCSSAVAGAIGVILSSVLFGVSFSTSDGSSDAATTIDMLAALTENSGASLPLLAIPLSVALGLSARRILFLQKVLNAFDAALSASAPFIGKVMPFIVLFLGITLGVRSGASETLGLYVWMCGYTLLLCALWWCVYVFLVLKCWAQQPIRKVIREYYLPTAVFALGTCSSLATLPVNLANVKKYGVQHSIANFVVPIGAVINMDMSAMAYVAYAPFIMTVVFDMPITWMTLVIAWPAVVLFSIASPGLGAGIGTALWSATLFASLLGLTGEDKSHFIVTWLAFSGGLPDMLRTTNNVTGDGFTAILFDRLFSRSGRQG